MDCDLKRIPPFSNEDFFINFSDYYKEFITNIKNDDTRCLLYCVSRYFNKKKEDNEIIDKKLIIYVDDLE